MITRFINFNFSIIHFIKTHRPKLKRNSTHISNTIHFINNFSALTPTIKIKHHEKAHFIAKNDKKNQEIRRQHFLGHRPYQPHFGPSLQCWASTEIQVSRIISIYRCVVFIARLIFHRTILSS